ncbi:hypothetical protein [Sciscionella sediminilitoris]|uniref:hypothetical protein n=1 Tax=Sciscionella sediminilitoris TaxID=1445613 RepID=UPI00068A7836|nr:hypothetical protein [Sciscionella sp. SE31]
MSGAEQRTGAARGAEDGEQVLTDAVAAAERVFGPELEAAYALGSLAHGGFAPLVSDVDLALVLTEVNEHTPSGIAEIRARTPGALAERLSVFYADWSGVRAGRPEPGRLPAIDRLDLLESGRLLYGTDRRTGAEPPGRHELVRCGAEFAADRFDPAYLREIRDPAALPGRGVRAVTKLVLFPVRFLYTLREGRIGHNQAAGTWYRGAARDLVLAALDWREHGLPADPVPLLESELAGLYLEFLDAYIDAVPEFAEQLRVVRSGLTAPDRPAAPRARGTAGE